MTPLLPFTIVGVPVLTDFFGDAGKRPDADALSDGSRVTSSKTRSLLVWDHGRRERQFTHPDSGLPVLHLYQGTGYFHAFCTRLRRFYNDNVDFAFSTSYSLPSPLAVVSDDEGDTDDEGEAEDWYTPSSPTPQHSSTQENNVPPRLTITPPSNLNWE